MFKQCTVILLLLAFMVTSFSRTVVVVDFYANQDYIAKNLCENRFQPMKRCCGKCQLRKRLAHQDNEDRNNPERRAENKNEVFFSEEQSISLATPVSEANKPAYALFSSKAPIDRALAIFHPPGA